MSKQNSFGKIDEYFAGKKSSEVYMMTLIVVAIIGFLVWYFIFPLSQSFFDDKKSENLAITKKLNLEKNYIKSKTVKGDESYYIKDFERKIKNNQQKLVSIKKLNSYIDGKLRELSYLLFNNENWAKFLDSISEIAREHKVKIVRITNQINEPNYQKVEQMLNVHVFLKGDFHGIMNFINTLEESMLIVDIHNIELNKKKDIDGLIDIAVWGIKY